MLIEHIEKHLGKIDFGWKLSDNKYNITTARFRNQPYESIVTYTTIGLSNYYISISGKTVRQELVFSAHERFDSESISSFLLSFSEYLISNKKGLLRGDIVGPQAPIIPVAEMNGVYSSIPVFFEESFYVFKSDAEPVIFVWLIPLYEIELSFVKTKGWNAFEDALEKMNCDFGI